MHSPRRYSGRQMDLNRILREGFIAGCIGAAVVAIWFLIVDTINGQPLFTPAMLGSAVFWGAHDPASVVIEPARIFEYTPSTLFLVIVGFCFFEVGFYILMALLAKPLLSNLVWWNVAIGNGLAALGMGYYLWREHPRIGEELRRHPLGETEDGE